MNRHPGLCAWILVVLSVGVRGEALELPSWSLAIDSTSFGTLEVGYARGRGGDDWSCGAGISARLPVLLLAKGGGLDTGAVEAEGWAELIAGPWDLRVGAETGLDVQTQVLGNLTSWTAGLSLEPGARWQGGRVWLGVGVDAALISVIRPSHRASATFDDRYEDGPRESQPQSVLLGLPAVRPLFGVGVEGQAARGWFLGLEVGVRPPPSSLGWTDGFSFGEVPFTARVSSRWQ